MCIKMSKLGAGPATLTDSLIIHCALRHISFVIPVPLRRQGHTKCAMIAHTYAASGPIGSIRIKL